MHGLGAGLVEHVLRGILNRFLDDGGSAVGVGGVCLYVSGCACGLRANVGVEHRWASVVGVGKDAFR